MYVYKTVPAPMILGVKNQKETDKAIQEYSEYINKECVDGWEFHSMETMTTQFPQGCLGVGSPQTVTYNMLVFKKDISN